MFMILCTRTHTPRYAYALSGGFATKHSAKGVVALDLRPPAHVPLGEGARTPAASSGVDSKARAALSALLAILGAVGVNVLLLVLSELPLHFTSLPRLWMTLLRSILVRS